VGAQVGVSDSARRSATARAVAERGAAALVGSEWTLWSTVVGGGQTALAPAAWGEPIATALLNGNDPRAAKKSTLPSAEMRAALNAGATNLDATKQGVLPHARPVDAAKARRAATRPVAGTKQAQGRRRIDQEFGF